MRKGTEKVDTVQWWWGCCDKADFVAHSVWNWFVGERWKSLKLRAGEALECYKMNVMISSGGNLEDHIAEGERERGPWGPSS